MKRILLLVAIIGLIGTLSAQNNIWNVHLSGQVVKSIDFENDYVWAATESFLVRLNKLDKSIANYSYPAFAGNMQIFLKIDKNGVKWIVLSKFGYKNKIYGFSENRWDEIEFDGEDPISSLAIDKDNKKWITTGSYYSHLWKLEQGNCMQYTHENSALLYNNVSQVASDKNGNIWLLNYGNFGGLVSADITLMKYDTDKWNLYFAGRDFWPATRVHFDSMGNTWVERYASAQKLDEDNNLWSDIFFLSADGFKRLYNLLAIEVENRFWCSKPDEGIAVHSGSEWSFYTRSNSDLPSDTVYQIAIDADGTKWIGTANGLVELQLTTSIVQESKLSRESELYPNPANDYINLRLPGGLQHSTVDIFNMQGQVVKSFNTNNNQNRMNISHFPAGVYLVRIQSDENHFLKKFVKQ